MNVLHITSGGFIRGIDGLYELNLCDFLCKSGIGVKALTLTGDPVRDYVVSFSESKHLLNQLVREETNFEYDIVHIHSALWAEFPYLALLLARLLNGKRPTILTTHAFDPDMIRRPDRLFKAAIKDRNIAYLRYSFRMTSYYYVKHIIAMSNQESAHLIHELAIDENKISVVPNAVNFARFSKWYNFREMNSIEEESVILYVGQLILLKGVSYLIEAFEQLLTDNHNCRLVIVTRSGYCDIARFFSSLKPSVIKKITVFNQLNDSFTDEDLISAYKSCDVFVLPSLKECSPGVVLEAMAAGKPVVTTTAVPEMVRDGFNGFLVPPKSSNYLASKLTILLADKNLRNTMGKRGFEIAKNDYNWDIVGKRILQLYQKITE
jgi:glycosyltransferase involved in cell wall biosynthesis